MMYCPRPGEIYDAKTVIASGWNNDDRIGLMLLRPESPYFEVAEFSALSCEWRMVYDNIVPAARAFDEQFGFWGET